MDGDEGDVGNPDTATLPAAPPDTTQRRAGPDMLAWSSESTDVSRSLPEIAVVEDIRSGRHDNFDRLVIELQNNVVPGYSVRYLDERAVECGSGRPVSVAGSVILEVRLEPARGHDEQGQSTVDHGERAFDLPLLRESEVSCDFEAVFTAILGMTERAPYRVMELQAPARLAIDLQHGSD